MTLGKGEGVQRIEYLLPEVGKPLTILGVGLSLKRAKGRPLFSKHQRDSVLTSLLLNAAVRWATRQLYIGLQGLTKRLSSDCHVRMLRLS